MHGPRVDINHTAGKNEDRLNGCLGGGRAWDIVLWMHNTNAGHLVLNSGFLLRRKPPVSLGVVERFFIPDKLKTVPVES